MEPQHREEIAVGHLSRSCALPCSRGWGVDVKAGVILTSPSCICRLLVIQRNKESNPSRTCVCGGRANRDGGGVEHKGQGAGARVRATKIGGSESDAGEC